MSFETKEDTQIKVSVVAPNKEYVRTFWSGLPRFSNPYVFRIKVL